MTEKEIGMQKLMKYVEEMQKEGINICRPRFQEYYLLEMMLVSKHYGLIKWLVKNDKINVKEIGKIGMTKMKGEPTSYMFDKIYSDLESLLMLLSISDTPIEDLLLYLK